jgi:hypothetical protein
MTTIGRIGLVSGGTDFWARLITVVTGSPVHHAVLDLGDGTCASAEPTGVERLPIEHFERIEWVEVGTLEQREAAAAAALAIVQRHAPYNKPSFVLAGLNSLGLIPPLVQEPLALLVRRFGYICSSLVDACFLTAGLDLFPGPSELVWPGELARLVPNPVAVSVPDTDPAAVPASL